jgi:DNA transformation protein
MPASADSQSFLAFVLDQLQFVGEVESRAMFGGHGLYCMGIFFACVHRGRLYFKTDETTRQFYIDAGMGPFRPNAKQTLKSYYEVPVDALEDTERLADLALAAIRVGRGGEE